MSLPRVGIVGGGLAGLAAAADLAESGVPVELFEAKSRLGGRAASFRDPASGDLVDHCQHVSMGCCTNLADFCRRTGIALLFRRHHVLHFFGPDGQRHDFAASRWLPAPLHLGKAFLGLGYLSVSERREISRVMLRLAREPAADTPDTPTAAEWLKDQGQSPEVIERFWGLVLISALGESPERASLAYARKVFIEGFLSHRSGWEVLVPTVPLGELYGVRMERWLEARGVTIRLGTAVARIEGDATHVNGLELLDGSRAPFDHVIVAVPWKHVAALFGASLRRALPCLDRLDQIEPVPITAVHLWFDRPITPLPHAVLVGRLSQWLFSRGTQTLGGENSGEHGHHYQVVISASRSLTGGDREAILRTIVTELAAIWPVVRDARLLSSRIVTDPAAVFSVRPGIDRLRPVQQTPTPNLLLAGDWTATGWPATMEGAVRSGHLAAEAVLAAMGQRRRLLAPDLPRGGMARLLLGSK